MDGFGMHLLKIKSASRSWRRRCAVEAGGRGGAVQKTHTLMQYEWLQLHINDDLSASKS
jgi:hypothetical protein